MVLNLIILVSPKDTTFNVSANPVLQGDSVVFTCSSLAVPSAVYYQIFLDGNLIQNNTNGTYVLNSAYNYDEGLYECRPINLVGVDSIASKILNVSGKFLTVDGVVGLLFYFLLYLNCISEIILNSII